MLLVAAVLVAGATSIAAIPGPDGTIKGCIKKRAPNKGAIRVIDHNRRCSSRETALGWNQKGSPGTQGEQGAPGQQGGQGLQGPQGANGSPDTGADILGKLAPVDGSGSGLDADSLDGRPSGDFLPARAPNFGAALPALPLTWAYYDFDTTGAAGTEFPVGSGFIYIERTGTVGEFRVCARNNVAAGYNLPFVVRIADGAGTPGTLTSPTGTTETCSADFLATDGREFTIWVQGALIVGTPRGNIVGTGPLPNRWRLIGLAF